MKSFFEAVGITIFWAWIGLNFFIALFIYPLFLIAYPCIGMYEAILGKFTGILIINESISRCLSFGFYALLAMWFVPMGIRALITNLGLGIRK
jgi:hypothetical protein